MKIGDLIKQKLVKKEDQSLLQIENSDCPVELVPLSSVSDDEDEVERLRNAV